MQIVIQLTPQGQIQLQSSTNDQVAIYGLLELAKDAVREGVAKQKNGAQVVAASANVLSALPSRT